MRSLRSEEGWFASGVRPFERGPYQSHPQHCRGKQFGATRVNRPCLAVQVGEAFPEARDGQAASELCAPAPSGMGRIWAALGGDRWTT